MLHVEFFVSRSPMQRAYDIVEEVEGQSVSQSVSRSFELAAFFIWPPQPSSVPCSR